ncbi:MAG: glycosyltransferase N-terminal domain-containing protein, partial [Bacteroidales bacterium]|nr:glycosyltransferase N-terminal domain-containing protein [Bacteroidales bacterium]
MISVLYSISIAVYTAGIFIFSLFNKKAKQWVSGRKGLVKGIHKAGLNNPLWFHCASLGEFEQGRPLIEAIKEQQPATPILLTFYSPSGYEIRKNNDLADYTCYL